ncbi:MAG: lipid-A-disaccharide synthase [Chloroflexaceae bacterium]|nr:lipid-A-disaccharide synthase [Chloroflexaceae bacterium]
MVRIFISTGEVSGDLQGALLVEALHRQASYRHLSLEILALGGDRMAAAGATLLGNTTEIGSVGLLESLPFILPTWRIQRQAKRYLRQHPPDVLVLMDYLGPNLSIGSFVRRNLPKVPIVYYIAPQNWVWSPSPGTTQQIVSICDRLLAIFQQEGEFYRKHGANVTWVGHPLLDRLQSAPSRPWAREHLGIGDGERAIVLLPASRQQEIKYLLPVICESARQLQAQLPNLRFLVPISRPGFRATIARALERYSLPATLLDGQTLTAIAAADLAIAKSGTVNLEIALLNVPQVVIYRVHPLTMWAGRRFLKFSIPFMSPPNLVLMEPIVPELLQEAASPERIVQEALNLLLNEAARTQLFTHYQTMRSHLGEVGVSDRAAAVILEMGA